VPPDLKGVLTFQLPNLLPKSGTLSSESVRDKTQQMIAENQKEDIQKNPILELAAKAERRSKTTKARKNQSRTRDPKARK
jgi:hypothetical protein